MAYQLGLQNDLNRLREVYTNLTGKQLGKAISRAINHSLAKGRTQAKREITSIYNIPSSYALQSMKVRNSNSTTMTGSVNASSAYTPLHHFSPRQTTSVIGASGFSQNISISRTRRGEMRTKRMSARAKMGMAVTIKKGERKVLPSAFFVRGQYIAARGGYNRNQQFVFRKNRISKKGNDTPISSVKTLSVYKGAINATVQKRLADYVMGEYGKRVIHEIERGLQYGTR